MGIGIWSMHYLGMLAFRLPVPVRYDWPTVLLSLLTGDSRIRSGLVCCEPACHGIAPDFGRRHSSRRGHRGFALHRMASMRLPGNMPLFSLALMTLSVVIAIGRFVHVALVDILFSGRC